MKKEKGKSINDVISNGKKTPRARTELNGIVIDFHCKACKIPDEWRHMIVDIIQNNMDAISVSCGNLELAYRRTLMHAEELNKIERENKK